MYLTSQYINHLSWLFFLKGVVINEFLDQQNEGDVSFHMIPENLNLFGLFSIPDSLRTAEV